MKKLSIVFLLAWWVQIFSDGQFLHGGVFPTLERCEIAKNNLMASYRALGYRNVVGFCVNHGGGS